MSAAAPTAAPTAAPPGAATAGPVTGADPCAVWDLVCKAKQSAANAVSSGASDAIANLADAIAHAQGTVLASLGSAWVDVRTPSLIGGAGAGNTVTFIQGSLWFYMAAIAMLGVIVGGARMAWQQRAQPGLDLLKGLGTLVLVAGAGLPAIGLLVTISDGFAQWILDRSTAGTDFGRNISALLALNPGLGPILVIVLGLVAIFASFVQIMLMVARAGMLVLLAGVLPTAASAATIEEGRASLRKAAGWTLAFVLYKPAAAIVYATAFRLTGSHAFGADGLTNILVGLVLMVLALFALPALMRFITPLVSQTAGSPGGGGAAAAGAAAAALPTGAIAVQGRAAGAGGAGPVGRGSGPGGDGAPGGSGPAGPGGSPGPGGTGRVGAAGSSAAPAPGGATGTTGAAGSTAGATSAGASAGPAGLAAGAAVDVATRTGKAAVGAARGAAATATTEGGPDGRR